MTKGAPSTGQVTCRIGEEFGVAPSLGSGAGEAPERAAARSPRVALRDVSAARRASTARWPPGGSVPPPRSSRRPFRPKFPATLAMWSSESRARHASDGSALRASIRALTERASTSDEPASGRAEARRPRAGLESSSFAQLGGLDHVPRSTVPSHEITSMGLDHRQAFLLSLVDGVSTIGDIVGFCGMEEVDALSMLCELQDLVLVIVDPPA